jgi:hypothetical protein
MGAALVVTAISRVVTVDWPGHPSRREDVPTKRRRLSCRVAKEVMEICIQDASSMNLA